MTDLDLTEAVAQAADRLAILFPDLSEQAWEDATDDLTDTLAPVIERQVRERIAAELKAEESMRGVGVDSADLYENGLLDGLALARERIVHGGGS